MENLYKIFKFLKPGINNQKINIYGNCRYLSKNSKFPAELKEVQKLEGNLSTKPKISNLLRDIKSWNEYEAVKKIKYESRGYKNIRSMADMVKYLQSLNELPVNLRELHYYLMRQRVRTKLIEQKFLPERYSILRADLAAAHFIIARGGSVKLLGEESWIGMKEKRNTLPSVYTPGVFIEAINAEGTELYFEGLQNLVDLNYLSWLSLKGLDNIDNWCLDWLSAKYGSTLKYLDISNCKNVTYRGLSCFYRFKQLKTLNVEGISDSPEFKVACLMLQEIFVDLEISGINLSIPEEIPPFVEVKSISKEENSLTS